MSILLLSYTKLCTKTSSPVLRGIKPIPQLYRAPRSPTDIRQDKASGAYHDFVIRCGDRSWNVHRVVICLQSAFFQKVCDGPFEEARSGELTLAGNDPAIVDCMIQYLYLGDYSAAATPAADPAPPQGRLVTHALVYAIADQCAIPHLQTVARQKTAAAVAFDWRDGGSDESFVQAADLAWTTTPQSDRGLRDCYLAFIDNHTAELRGSAAFFELLRRNAELVVNVVESAWDRAAAGGSSLGFGTPFVGDTEDTPWPGGKKGKKKARGRGPDGPPLLDSDLY